MLHMMQQMTTLYSMDQMHTLDQQIYTAPLAIQTHSVQAHGCIQQRQVLCYKWQALQHQGRLISSVR